MLGENENLRRTSGNGGHSGQGDLRPLAERWEKRSQFSVSEDRSEKESPDFVSRSADFFLSLSIFAVSFGVPVFFLGKSFQGIAFEKQIYFLFWILVGLVAWMAGSWNRGELKLRKTPLDIPIIIFLSVHVLSTIFSVDRWHSFFGFFGDPSRGLLNIIAIIVFYYLFLSNLSRKHINWALAGIAVSGMIAIVWAVLLAFGFSFGGENWGLPINPTGSMNGFLLFLGSLVPIFMVLAFSCASSGKRFLASLLSLLVIIDVFALFLLYQYVFWLALLVGSVFFLIFVMSGIVRPGGKWAVLPMVVFFLILLSLMTGRLDISKADLPLVISVPYETSLDIAKESIKERPILGYGPANYGFAFSRHLPGDFDNMGVRFFQDNGIFLETISSVGILGMIALAVLLLTFLGVSLFLLSRDKERNKIISLGLFSSFLILLVGVLAIKIEAAIFIYVFVLGSLAMGSIYLESNTEEDYLTLSLKASPKFALTLAFVYLLVISLVAFSFIFLFKVALADVQMGKALKEGGVSEEGSIAEIRKAITNNPREGRYYARLSQEYMVLVNSEMLKEEKERDIDRIQSYLNISLESGNEAERLMPNDITTVESLANIYENSGLYVRDALKLSEEQYEKARSLEPGNPDFPLALGQLKLKMIDPSEDKAASNEELVQEARKLFEEAEKIRENYAPTHYDLSVVREMAGDQDGAIEEMATAFRLRRGDLSYAFNLARLYQARGKDSDKEVAENIYKQILSFNDKELNTRLKLGLLYETWGRREEAITELEKVKELLPEGSDDARAKIEKMIDNINKGIPNNAESLGLSPENSNPESPSQEPVPVVENQEETAPPLPEGQADNN